MRTRLFVFLLALIAMLGPACAADIALRYDGVYVGAPFDDDKEYCAYLRFYPQGTVITVSSVCDRRALPDIKRWFRASQAGPKRSGVSRGKVQISGEQISFSAVSREGKVAYRGGMVGDRLRLGSHSFINGNEDVEVYSFVPW